MLLMAGGVWGGLAHHTCVLLLQAACCAEQLGFPAPCQSACMCAGVCMPMSRCDVWVLATAPAVISESLTRRLAVVAPPRLVWRDLWPSACASHYLSKLFLVLVSTAGPSNFWHAPHGASSSP
jgi:hypothetical protein